MENVGLFYGHLEYITAIRYILWPFGELVVIWYIFHCFGILYQEKSGNPGLATGLKIQLSSCLSAETSCRSFCSSTSAPQLTSSSSLTRSR
jgi:hypothetical protein